MRRLGQALAIGMLSATPALAAIDFGSTNNGLPHVSGGRQQNDSYGLSSDLFNTNNKLVGDLFHVSLDESRDWSAAVDPDDGPLPLGCLIVGPNGTLWTYDRLAALPVLQLIGFDQTETWDDQKRFEQTPPLRQLTIMPSFESVAVGMGSAAPPDESIPPTVATPEPASLGLLVAGAALLFKRPNRRPTNATPQELAVMT